MSYITVSEIAHPIHSNYLPSCLRTPELPYFQIQMALLAVREGEKDNKNTEALQLVQAMQ